MKKFLKTAAFFISLLSMIFVSCEKEGDNGENSGEVKTNEFVANVKISQDLIDACESIEFVYKDADGKVVTEKIDPSELSVEKYEYLNKEYEVRVWTKKFQYTKNPADVYFKPVLTKDPEYTTETSPNFIYDHLISGADKSSSKQKCTLGVRPEKVQEALDSVLKIINTYILGE